MRGIGSITIRIHIQINPGKEKGRHKSMGNVANLLWVLPQRKCKSEVWMCTWGGGKGVRWASIWWMQKVICHCLLLTREAVRLCGKWKTSWRESPEFHRTPSLPSRSHRHCQACLLCPGVFMHLLSSVGEGMEWHVQWHMEIFLLTHSGPKIPTFQSEWPGQGLKCCCVHNSVSHQSSESTGFMNKSLVRHFGLPHLQRHPIPPTRAIFAVTKMLMFVSHKRNWNVQDNPYLD